MDPFNIFIKFEPAMEENVEIKKANPTYRKKVLIYSILILIGFIVLNFISQRYLNTIMEKNENNPEIAIQKLIQTIHWLSILISVISILFSLFFARLAFYILRSQKFPAPEMEVLRDTPIKTGKSARLKGYLVLAISIIMFIVAIAAPMLIHSLIKELIQGG